MDEEQEESEEAALRPEEIVPTGGTWHGHLFDNPFTGLMPTLTWSLTVDCRDVTRDDCDSPVNVTVEWLPLSTTSWSRLAPDHAAGSFGAPAESSVYYYEHHRFSGFDVLLHQQRDLTLRATLTLCGDHDGLGVDPVSVEAWLDLEGIIVQLSDVSSPDQALQRLADFTDTTGLVLDDGWAGAGYCFRPSLGCAVAVGRAGG